MAAPRAGNHNKGMSLWYLAWIFGAGLVLWMFGRANGNLWPFALYLVAVSIAYVLSLHAHPLRNCWYCKGTGKHWGLIWNYSTRICIPCDGKARVPRLGVRVLNIKHEGWRTRKK
jgi:hypothetical protein